jgi:hypothetical protein
MQDVMALPEQKTDSRVDDVDGTLGGGKTKGRQQIVPYSQRAWAACWSCQVRLIAKSKSAGPRPCLLFSAISLFSRALSKSASHQTLGQSEHRSMLG